MRLHLGCGENRFLGWVNLDLNRGHDLSRGLPDWPAGSVEAVYSCHFLEHITQAEGQHLLDEVHRVLVPGGAVRIGVPDFRLFAEAYVAGDVGFSERYFERYCPPDSEFPPHEDPREFRSRGAAGALLAIVHGWGHRAIYDEALLRDALEQAGFPAGSVLRAAFGQSHYWENFSLDRNFEDHTVFVEAQKAPEPS